MEQIGRVRSCVTGGMRSSSPSENRGRRGSVGVAVSIREPNDVKVRLAREEDLGELMRLLGLLFEQEEEFDVQPAAQQPGLTALIAMPERARVLLAERAGYTVGMVTLQLVVSTALGGPAGLLEDMVVDPSARSDGVGSILLTAAIEQAVSLDCRRLTLLTDGENADAQRFYRRHGFACSTMVSMRLVLS